MNRFSLGRIVVLGATAAWFGAAAIGIGSEGCSSSTPSQATPSMTATPDGSSNAAPQCANPSLTVAFDPAYSAFVPNSVHTFQIPFGVLELATTDTVTWSASDSSMVAFAPGTVNFGKDHAVANAMVTTMGAGDVTIFAQSGSQCGSAQLHITAVTDDDWSVGNERYNNGTLLARQSTGRLARVDGGSQAACTNCHGMTATNSSFTTVEHTPLQTGGFSDTELIGIFTMAMVPPGGYFDPTIVRQSQWVGFHQWSMSADQAKGIVVYLRSLTPAPQTGKNALPMRGGRDGGGGRRMDGGRMGMMPDAAAQDSAEASDDAAPAPAETSVDDSPSQGDAGAD